MADTNYLDLLLGLAKVFSPQEAEAKVVARDPQAQKLIDAVRTGAVMPGTREKDLLVSGRFDPVRKGIYRDVLQAAEERPETVQVGMVKQMPGGAEDAAGAYAPARDEIVLREFDPFYSASNRYTAVVPTAAPYQDTLSHELVHFLLSKLTPELQEQARRTMPQDFYPLALFPRMSPAERATFWSTHVSDMTSGWGNQHAMIDYLLGGSDEPAKAGPTGKLQPDPAAYADRRPFQPKAVPRNAWKRDLYAEALRRILRDPTLLKQALEGLQPAGAR